MTQQQVSVRQPVRPTNFDEGEIDFDQQWQTSFCQCGGYESCCADWCIAIWCPQAAFACARTNVDGTHCCFNLCCSFYPTQFNVVRRRYGIQGDDFGDAMYTTCLPTCAGRQVLTESKMRGHLPDRGQYKWASQDMNVWQRGFCTPTGSCCYAMFCPNCIAAQTRAKFDDSHCCFTLCFGTLCDTYNMVRQGYGIAGNCCCDCFVTQMCYPCALSRAYDEVEPKYMKRVGIPKSLCCHC